MSLVVAVGQFCSGVSPAANLDLVSEYAARAAAGGARLLVLPEAAMCRFGVPLRPVAEPADGPWATRLAEIAEETGLVIVAGMYTPGGDGRVRNTLRAVGPGVDAGYDKIHLFDAFGFRESDSVAPGSEPALISIDGVMIGLTTCYDVRFPGLFLELADRGARAILVAASWGSGPGKVEQWQTLVRARALDSTCFVLAAGQADPVTVGEPPQGGAPTGVGYSAIIAPDGLPVAELGPEPGILIQELDLDVVAATRERIPVLANRVW